jgi:hypothetical protein
VLVLLLVIDLLAVQKMHEDEDENEGRGRAGAEEERGQRPAYRNQSPFVVTTSLSPTSFIVFTCSQNSES